MAVEQAYCYQKFNTEAWTRWPDEGFLRMDNNGMLTGENVFSRVMTDYNGGGTNTLMLSLDCWGWDGGMLYHLGGLTSAPIDPNETRELTVAGEGVAAEVMVGTSDLYKIPEVVVYFDHETYDYDMVYINAYITEDINDCIAHLPPDWSAADKDAMCAPYPQPSNPFGIKFVNPLQQQYVVWDVVGDI